MEGVDSKTTILRKEDIRFVFHSMKKTPTTKNINYG